VRELGDGWTIVTADGSLSAHFEHMVAITDGEPDVLTRLAQPTRMEHPATETIPEISLEPSPEIR